MPCCARPTPPSISAKRAGKDRVALYSQALHSAQEFRHPLEAELHHAVERREFDLVYQPRFDLQTRHLVAVEALLRWRHPEFGSLPTDQFIAVAEASGLISDIGRWVLGAACDQCRRWRDAGHPVRIAVNLSAVEFRHPNVRCRSPVPWRRHGSTPRCWSWRSPKARTWSARRTNPIRAWKRSGAWASGWRSTISAPAGRRWPTSNGCRSTCSRSTAPSCAISARTRATRRSSPPSSPWPAS